MSRAQAQYLKITNAGGTVLHRWQSYYSYRTVTWASQQWDYVAFSADGFTAGVSGDESSLSISAPATARVASTLEAAISAGHFVEVSIYEFDATVNNLSPQASQQLVAQVAAQIVGGSGSITRLTIQLGSALSPVGSQFPPRTFTTAIMGQGCRL